MMIKVIFRDFAGNIGDNLLISCDVFNSYVQSRSSLIKKIDHMNTLQNNVMYFNINFPPAVFVLE